MEEVNVEMASSSTSDADDRLLLSSLRRKMVDGILRFKHNDPEFTELHLSLSGLDERAMRRLGHLIGQSTYLDYVSLSNYRVTVAEFYDGLRFNQSITTLFISHVNLGGSRMASLGSVLSSNLNIKRIRLVSCNVDPTALDLLSDALSERSEKTLSSLDLSNNRLGDVDLDRLVFAVKGSKTLESLDFDNTGIGRRGCASLAKLLGDRRSGLYNLRLRGNSIDDEDVAILVDSLARNTQLRWIYLDHNSGITAIGLHRVLQLICDSSGIDTVWNSNHTLTSSGYWGAKELVGIMGSHDANLLRASLVANGLRGKLAARKKILWSHARGDLNIGKSSIDVRVMPRILGWIGDDSNESSAQLIQYHRPPLPKARIDAIRLDSFYRIVLARSADVLVWGEDS